MKGYIERLQDAIRRMHGCTAGHVAKSPVTELFKGKIVWQGEVEVFVLHGHPTAQRCYAWAYQDDEGKEHYTAVLEIPPVNSPRTAVQAALAAKQKERTNEETQGGTT